MEAPELWKARGTQHANREPIRAGEATMRLRLGDGHPSGSFNKEKSSNL